MRPDRGRFQQPWERCVVPKRRARDSRGVADVVVLVTNHAEYVDIEPMINERANSDGVVYDLWGFLDREELDLTYDGFGIAERPPR